MDKTVNMECDFETWLNQFLNFEKTPEKNIFWLETMRFLCEKFGNPQNSYKKIHVAGSKGKGSVCAFISSILEESGLKTGLYTSPHILSFYERISSAHSLFENEIYKKAENEMLSNEDFFKREHLPERRAATWFELVTLFAFLTFRQAHCDVSVLETGLGGRLDATNVVLPEVSVIMPIELEHTEFLGDTIEKIAYEKAGIIKEGIPVVCAHQTRVARSVFEKVACEKKSPIYFLDDFLTSYKYEIKDESAYIELVLKDFERPLNFTTKMLGEIQAENAAIACFAARLAFPQITIKQMEKGLSKAFLPARFEICKKFGATIIFDGAHTPNSIELTCKTFSKLFAFEPCFNTSGKGILLFACAKDKKMDEMSKILLKNNFCSIFLTTPGEKLSDLSELTQHFEQNLKNMSNEILYPLKDFQVISDFNLAFQKALKEAQITNQPLLICGSFYLIAGIKSKYF